MTEPHSESGTTPLDSPLGSKGQPIPASSKNALDNHAQPAEDFGLLDFANVLLRHWKLVLGSPLIASLMTLAISFVVSPTFTASTAFVPEASQGGLPSGIAGLAGQFGISLGAEASQSPEFYAEVVRSQEIMDRVLLSHFPDPGSRHNRPDTTTLLRILLVDGDSLADSLHHGRKKLDDLTSLRVDNRTNIVTLRVDSRYPLLAAAVANRFLEYLNDFNAKTRQSQARELRRFVEARVAEAEQHLREAEAAIKEFYERNRTWEQSARLRFEHEQLQRQVQIGQEVFLTLRREYETARIGEVNDTPVITTIYRATPPQEKSKPRRKLLVALAFFLGGSAGTVGAFGAEFLNRARRTDEGTYAESRRLVAHIRKELRNFLPGSDPQG
jgi:uncharacterized protein involved in exopolysaccharide biosynthesis